MRLLVFLAALVWLMTCAPTWADLPPQPAHDVTGNVVQHGKLDLPVVGHESGHARSYPSGTTELAGWTVNGGIDIAGTTAAGTRSVNLGAASSISQHLDLVKGQRYELYFVTVCAPAGHPVKTGVARIAGERFPFSKGVNEPVIWHEWSFQFVAGGPTNLVLESTTGESHGPYVGNIAVIAMGPKPPPAVVMASGQIVSVNGDVIVLDSLVMNVHVKMNFYLQKDTEVAAGWKPQAGTQAIIQFVIGSNSRREIRKIGPAGR